MTQKNLKLIILSLFFLWAIQSNSLLSFVLDESKVLTVAHFHYYPFALYHQKDHGYAFDVVHEAFTRHGYIVKANKLPLSRSIVEVTRNKQDIVLGLNPYHSDELIYSNTPIVSFQHLLYARNGLEWKYTDKESLNKVRLVTIRGFDYTPADKDYQDYINENTNNPVRVTWLNSTSTTDSIKSALKFIQLGRGDIYAGDIDQTEYLLKELKLLSEFSVIGKLKAPYFGFFAVGKNHPDAKHLIEIFEREMINMREDGTLESIFNKYKDNYGLKYYPFAKQEEIVPSH